MLTFHQRTEIIREMIADRMKFSPHPADISLSELQNWPEVFLWGTPEGTIFNIVTSYDLNVKQGCDSKEAIRAIEELEEGNREVFSGEDLIEYLIFRLQKEHPQFVHLYPEELLESFRDMIKKRVQIYDCQTFKTYTPTSEVVKTQSKIKDVQPVIKKDSKEFNDGKEWMFFLCAFVALVIIVIIGDTVSRNMREKREFEAIGCSVENFATYVSKYPHSKYNTEEICDTLLNMAIADGIPALKKFVSKCSGNMKYSKQIERAKMKLEDLYNQSYKECIESNTIDCWEKFIQLAPPEDLKTKAERRKNELKDKFIMNEIRRISTLKECDSLRSVHYDEKYRKLLDKKYIDLYVRDFRKKGQYESIAKLYLVNKYDTTSSRIVFRNNMNYNLKVYYSGKESGQIVIEAQKSECLSIPNGKYKLVAETITTIDKTPTKIRNMRWSNNNNSSAEDLLNQKIYIGNIAVSGGLYKTTYPVPKVVKKNPQKPLNQNMFNHNWWYHIK